MHDIVRHIANLDEGPAMYRLLYAYVPVEANSLMAKGTLNQCYQIGLLIAIS